MKKIFINVLRVKNYNESLTFKFKEFLYFSCLHPFKTTGPVTETSPLISSENHLSGSYYVHRPSMN